jgi:aminobenzoyl-glutamate transport protein
MSATVVPQMMTSGFTPEFSQLVFTAGSSITYALTPVMAYFVIYISYMEKYDKDGVSVIKCIKYIIPYAIALLLMWIVLLSLWYLVGIPLGISTMPTL